MYSPSLPDLVRWFDTDATMVKLTISLNILAFGLAQLLHGPLSDRFGRKPVLIVSLICVCVLCFACALAQTIEQLIIARILLGIAAAAEAVVGLAVIKDLYNEEEQVKALALLGMAIAIAPAASPIIGGFVHMAWGWQANFYLISALSILALFCVTRFLPESATPDSTSLRFSVVVSRYRDLLRNSDFLVHSAILGVCFGLIIVYVTAAPFVLIDLLTVPANQFGYYQASMVLAFFFGSLFASRLADQWSPFVLMSLGVALIIIGVVSLSLIILAGRVSPYSLTGAYMIMAFGMGPLFAVAPSRALRTIQSNAGSASAMLNGIEQTTAGLAALLISVIHDGTERPMAWISIALGLILAGLIYLSQRVDRTDLSTR